MARCPQCDSILEKNQGYGIKPSADWYCEVCHKRSFLNACLEYTFYDSEVI